MCGRGDVQGILGANCRHSYGPGDGKHNPYEKFDSEENRKAYVLSQRERTLERRIRKTKREVQALQTALDNAPADCKLELQAAYQKKAALLTKQNKAYNDFCEENDLKRLSDRLSIAKWDRKQAAKARGEARKKAVENPAKSGIIEAKEENGGNSQVHEVGNLNLDIYRLVEPDLQESRVIITDQQIQHIKERHPEDYEQYAAYLPEIVSAPDFILEANRPHTAFVLKSFEADGKRFEAIVRLKTSEDPEKYLNSIITFLKVDEKRFKRYLRTKKILYKKE